MTLANHVLRHLLPEFIRIPFLFNYLSVEILITVELSAYLALKLPHRLPFFLELHLTPPLEGFNISYALCIACKLHLLFKRAIHADAFEFY